MPRRLDNSPSGGRLARITLAAVQWPCGVSGEAGRGARVQHRWRGGAGHHGCRHRRGLRPQRHRRGGRGDLRAGAGTWPGHPEGFHRPGGRQGQARRGGPRRPARAGALRCRPGRAARRRPGHRGGARAPGPQAADLRGVGPGLPTGDDPRHQHLVAERHRDLGGHQPPQPGDRHPLLQPGTGDEAGRGGPHCRHRTRGGRRRRSALRPARQGRRHHQRPGRLHRQRAALRLPQPRGRHVRVALRDPGGHRRRHEARLRPADGPAGVDGPDRPGHRVRNPGHHVPAWRAGPSARTGAAAQADGDGGAARPEVGPGFLHLRAARLPGGRTR